MMINRNSVSISEREKEMGETTMELGLVFDFMRPGSRFLDSGFDYCFYFTWQKEELYHEYNRPGDSN